MTKKDMVLRIILLLLKYNVFRNITRVQLERQTLKIMTRLCLTTMKANKVCGGFYPDSIPLAKQSFGNL
mgnify:CR=1 FL=1